MPQGDVQAKGAMTNQFAFKVSGLVPMYFVRVGEITTELVVAEMSDGTWQSTGKIKPGELEVEQYIHHTEERLAMEAWFADCIVGGPLHKIPATVEFRGADNQPRAIYALDGVIVKGRKTPELDQSAEGTGAKMTWMLAVDNVVPLS